jgi:hypothetical protein
VEIEVVKEQMMQRVLKSADDFNNWLHWTQVICASSAPRPCCFDCASSARPR